MPGVTVIPRIRSLAFDWEAINLEKEGEPGGMA